MIPRKRTAFGLILAALLVLTAGCSSTNAPPSIPVSASDGLKELADIYSYRAKEKKPAPRKLDDLIEFEPALGNAWPKIQSGDLVVLWGVGQASGDKSVLAYEKKVESEGGDVLLRDGTVKHMTADEFKSAPKAK